MSIKATIWTISMALTLACQLAAYPQEEPELPSRIDYVSDYAQILDEQVESDLNRTLSEAERELGVEIYVLTVLTTEPLPINEYSRLIAEAWDLGEEDPKRKTLLFIIAVEDRLVRISTNRGLEEMLTDQRLKEILDTKITPRLYLGKFTQGITEGIDAIIRVLSEELHKSPSEGLGSRDILGVLLIVAVVALIMAAGWLLSQL